MMLIARSSSWIGRWRRCSSQHQHQTGGTLDPLRALALSATLHRTHIVRSLRFQVHVRGPKRSVILSRLASETPTLSPPRPLTARRETKREREPWATTPPRPARAPARPRARRMRPRR